MIERSCIFSGDNSRRMWDEINGIKKISDCKDALYTVCCKLQEFETKISKLSIDNSNH